jgi:transcriptional regulator with XRE-family HTH domain
MTPTFGEAVRMTRRRRQLSQDALANAAGLHRTHISLIERGLREPSLETLVKLCRALGVSPGEALMWHVAARAASADSRSTSRRRRRRTKTHARRQAEI